MGHTFCIKEMGQKQNKRMETSVSIEPGTSSEALPIAHACDPAHHSG